MPAKQDVRLPVDVVTAFARDGAVMIEHVLTDDDLNLLSRAFDLLRPGTAAVRQFVLPADLRVAIAQHPTLIDLAAGLEGHHVRLVRAIAFDKTPTANWFVPWHQDRAIAVRERHEVEGYASWTVKDGCHHVEPPIDMLAGIVTLRIHLDPCNEDHGPLEVIPGSHLAGRLDRIAIERATVDAPTRLCLAARGDVLAMRPLLLHRSQRARVPSHRRILHLEFASLPLPPPLEWAM